MAMGNNSSERSVNERSVNEQSASKLSATKLSATKLSATKQALLAIQKLQNKLDAAEEKRLEPIAIVGMSCRLPGDVETPEDYWELLKSGKDATGEVPATRWNVDDYYDENPDAPGKTYTKNGGFLNNIDQFDPAMFGISPREAASIDPQHRLLLELAWKALENANIPIEKTYNSDTGVFVGMTSTEYGAHLLWSGDTKHINAYAGTGGSLGVAAGRLSYSLGLTGPSLVVDTACSSSLVTTHLACQSLRAGECNIALSAGVNLILGPETFVNFSKAKMLAPDGRCKTFDASADGYARGEGGGVIVLKRLSDAQRDGDKVLAVIKGSAVNQDGPSGGLTVPNGPAQLKVIRKALETGKVKPEQVGYVEAHGTGTALGDPIEMSALNSAYDQQRKEPLWVGSVKTNFGHLESAAGIAGLIKSVLVLQHGQIPPHLHFKQPSPHIPWDELAVKIPTELQTWNEPLRYTGVSSFSFSGTNAHIVLATAPEPEQEQEQEPGQREIPVTLPAQSWRIIPVSAKSERSLKGLSSAWQELLATSDALTSPFANNDVWSELARTAVSGRSQWTYRQALIGDSAQAMHKRLKIDNLPSRRISNDGIGKVAFLFTGQGSQYRDMGQELYRQSQVFKEALDACNELLEPRLGHSLSSILYADDTQFDELLNITKFTQPVLFSIQYALMALWKSWGISPDAVLGHSIGEFAAACSAGVLSLQDAIKLIAERGRLMQELCEPGAMISVPLSEHDVKEAMLPWADDLTIASLNGSDNVVVSGIQTSAVEFVEELKASGIEPQILKVSHAFHSPMMEPMLSEFSTLAESVTYHAPNVKMYSTLTGTQADSDSCTLDSCTLDLCTSDYWVRHIASPVRFSQGMGALVNDGYRTFIEIGPRPTLCSLGREVAENFGDEIANNCNWLPSLRPQHSSWETMLQSLGHLWTMGAEVNWSELNGTGPSHARLPNYAFQRKRYWIDWDIYDQGVGQRDVQGNLNINNSAHLLLGNRLNSPALNKDSIVFSSQLNPETADLLAHHKIFGQVVLPAAAHIEIVLAAAAELWCKDNNGCPDFSEKKGTSDKFEISVEDVSIEQALILSEQQATSVQLVLNPSAIPDKSEQYYEFCIYSQADGEEWLSHTRGLLKVATSQVSKRDGSIDLTKIQTQCNEQLSVSDYYQQTHKVGIEHGEKFQALKGLWQSEGLILAQLQLPDEVADSINDFLLHPVILDAAFQMAGVPLLAREQETPYLPIGMAKLQRYQRTGKVAWCIVRPKTETTNTIFSTDIEIVDEAGNLLVVIDELRYQRVSKRSLSNGVQSNGAFKYSDWLYQTDWEVSVGYGANASWLPKVDSLAEKLATETSKVAKRIEWYGDFFVGLDNLVAHYAYDALQQLGLEWQENTSFTIDDLIERLSIIPEYHRLLLRLLEIMAEQNILTAIDQTWMMLAVDVSDCDQLVDELLTTFPDAKNELMLVKQCGSSLAQALEGSIEGLQLLFPDGSADLVTRFYTESPGPLEMNQLLHQTLAQALSQLPTDRGIRILEIGGGTGSSTLHLLPLLPAERCQYVFTDVSSVFTTKARERFAEYDFIDYQILDIEKEPHSQGFEAASFDIIIAANVLHATRDMAQTLSNVNQLLIPGGELLLLEGSSPQPWLDVTFGLTDGWWRFSDVERRADYPLLGINTWQQVLSECNFESMAVTSPDQVSGKDLCRQAIIVANKSLTATNGDWLILADNTGVSSSLAEQVRENGADCYLLPADQEVTAENLIQCLKGCDDLRFIVHARALDAVDTEQLDADGLELAQLLACKTAMNLLSSLDELKLKQSPRLILVSRTAVHVKTTQQPTQPESKLNISQSPLWAMGQVIQKEYPELQCKHIDIDYRQETFKQCIDALWQEAASINTESIALRVKQSEQQYELNENYHRYVPRLERVATKRPLEEAEIKIRPEAVYLITGGLGDLGLVTAKWLITEKGVRHLVLAGRQKAKADVQKKIEQLEALGAKVHTVSVDMTDSEQVNNMIASIAKHGELAGVIHAAGGMDDGVLSSMSWQRFAAVLAPKTIGGWNLHQACKNLALDFFLLYSSAASLLGPTAQANYAAANIFLDMLSAHRRIEGLPAMVINWGAWSTIGLAARAVKDKQLDARGMAGILPEQGLDVLEYLFKQPLEQVLVASIDWPQMLAQQANIPFFKRFKITGNTTDLATDLSLQEQLKDLPSGEQTALVTDLVKQQLIRILAIESTELIDEELGFFEMGMDSLTAVELRNALQVVVKTSLPSTLLFKYPTVSEVVSYLSEEVLGLKEMNSVDKPLVDKNNALEQNIDMPEKTIIDDNASVQEVSDMSDDELAAMIDAELNELEGLNE